METSRRGVWLWRSALALLMGAGAASCLGDVEIIGPGADGEIEADINPLEDACESGEVRCNGSWLERCGAGASELATRWNKIQDCRSPALCDAEAAQCNESPCGTDRARCDGAAPQLCREDFTDWENAGEACINAGYCAADGSACAAEGKVAPCCLEAPCTAGEVRCNGSVLERCRAGQDGYDVLDTCASQALCEPVVDGCQDSGACECNEPACPLAGELSCMGLTLVRCSPDQTNLEFLDTCVTPELCEDARTSTPTECREPCAVGEFRCDGADLMICNPGRTGFVLQQTCPAGTICRTTGACLDTCATGERQCQGAQIEQCNATQDGFEPSTNENDLCATPELCQDDPLVGQANCQNPACGVNAFNCNGAQLEQCNAGRTAFAPVGQACPRADLCSAERGRCDFCVPNRRECTPAPQPPASRTCEPDGNAFGELTPCPLGCIANTGQCQTCAPGSYRCQNGQLSSCAADGLSFAPLNRATDCNGATQVSCNGNTVVNTPCGALGCNTTRNACNQCAGNTRQCVGNTDNFRVCQPNGLFGDPEPCGANLECEGAGACVCEPGEVACNGNALVTCNAAGTAFAAGGDICAGNVRRTCAGGALTQQVCGSPALCASGTGAACGACVNGTRSCSAGANPQPLVCTGGQLTADTACPADFSCEGAGLCRCDAGDVRCEAGVVTECNAAGTTFAPARCDGATLRTCSAAGAVVPTQCGSAALCLASTGNTCATCLPDTPPACNIGGELETCVDGQLVTTPCDEGEVCLLGVCLGLAITPAAQ